MKPGHLIVVSAALLIGGGALLTLRHVGSLQHTTHQVDFSRDIRPILNQSCVSCHGGVRQKNGVSFIYREEALGTGKSGRPTIVPGHPETSELIARVTSTDPEARMPYHAPPLPPRQIALLREWIKEGAPWKEHWAFVAPKPQALPAVKHSQWPHQPLDRFILARLEREGLEPSHEAGKTELLRRVSFDLTGLPPTPEELAAFLADNSTDAYEKQVDRLLASAHYGERWAALWLDLARYADNRGYKYFNRPSWPYRDWVIGAFNQNLPYDRFVITQLAGDLLPTATFEDRIATAFQRQTLTNDEGGTDDEEFRVIAVMDRVATTWSVLNGLTMNCVQCHSHPYDPIRHAEYYKSLAFFNTSRDADLPDDSPNLPIAEPSRRNEVAQLVERKAQLSNEVVATGRSLSEQTHWSPLPIATATANEALGLKRILAQLERVEQPSGVGSEYLRRGNRGGFLDLFQGYGMSYRQVLAKNEILPLKIEDGEARAVGIKPMQAVIELVTADAPSVVTALRIEVSPMDTEKARSTPEDGFIVSRVEAWVLGPDGHERKLTFRYFAADSQDNLTRAIAAEDPRAGGFGSFSKLFQTRWVVAIPDRPLTLAPGSRLKVQLTHTLPLQANFEHVRLDASRDQHWMGLVDDQHMMVRLAELMQADQAKPTVARRVRFSTSSDERWTALGADKTLTAQLAELTDVEHRLERIPTLPLPVMAEQPAGQQRQTLEFERGNFLDKIGPALPPDVPAVFPKLPPSAPRNRLTLARWFFSPGQPLTARVAVNRYWEQLFGTGIVETLEDFGSAGEAPSHPQLLDWLALHFENDLHWDMKALLRELVTSATYRQSAALTPALLKRDPRNRLLARGPQQRLTAEMVRDQALLASGLLNPAMGGPPVMPPEPAGVDAQWQDATGPDRYRRAIYTFLKRTAIYPSFVAFDASAHEVSLARRVPTNTPLQALVTLNDPVYEESAQSLTRRMAQLHTASGAEPALQTRLNYGAECVLSRDLAPPELDKLEAFYVQTQATPTASGAKGHQKEALASSGPPGNKDLRALTAVAAVLLNLDAALTR